MDSGRKLAIIGIVVPSLVSVVTAVITAWAQIQSSTAGSSGTSFGTAQTGSGLGSVSAGTAPSKLPDNMRCNSRAGIAGGIAWWPCAQVSGSRVRFLVRLENRATAATEVTVQLGYIKAASPRQVCPDDANKQLTVAPGKATLAGATTCSVPRQGPVAVQAVASVVESGASISGAPAMKSETLQIQSDGAVLDFRDRPVVG